MASRFSVPLIEKATSHQAKTAIIDPTGHHSYETLLLTAQRIAGSLLGNHQDLSETRVAFLVPSGLDYVATQWGIWLAGGMAVPLCPAHPVPELEYVIENSEATILVGAGGLQEKLQPLATKRQLPLFSVETLKNGTGKVLPPFSVQRKAMILYTSGTTSRPKGVVTTHAMISAQIQCLVEAWQWHPTDHILHVLPLHHVHGIINVLSCALWVGATCEMLPQFEEALVWEKFIKGPSTLFMAVPTIYSKLISHWQSASLKKQQQMSAAVAKFRLTVSGSAALPVSVFESWQAMTGQIFLERYGMTEIGMALSNPLLGERKPGFVGMPLPGVALRLVDEEGAPISAENTPGEIQVKGPCVFLEYWKKPEATQAAFKEGWFCTGDTAVMEQGYYRILGRNSVDIIKSGGYKISALEIEEELRKHPAIEECAVVGVADEEWGERVSAAVVLHAGSALSLEELRAWGKERLAAYKVPSNLLTVTSLPRNVMGKVTKPDVQKLFHPA